MFLAVTGIVTAMSYSNDERATLADVVRRARVEKGLDKEQAARIAEMNSITWKRVEDAETVRDASLGKVLTSLGLPDAADILEGHQDSVLTTVPTDDLLDEIRRRIGDSDSGATAVHMRRFGGKQAQKRARGG